jgi:TonB family protein
MSTEWLSRQWVSGLRHLRNLGFTRSFILLALMLAYAGALYEITHARARATLDGPPMFRPAIARNAPVQEARPIRSRPWQPPVAERSIYGVRAWHFPRIDIWPVAGNEVCPTPNDTGPLMDTDPVAEEEQTQLHRAPAQPTSVPTTQKPRMVVWLRPSYTLDWARTEMEGTIRLGFRIRPTGETYQTEIEQSSGSQKLDATALEAAKSWKFTPARWQGRSIDGKATVELTFRFFEYSVSRIDDQAVTRASKRDASRTVHVDRSEVVRRLVDQLRSKTSNVFVAPGETDRSSLWPAAMRDWGPTSGVQYLGTLGRSEWRRYNVKLKFRTLEHAESVAVRWELYRVVHDNHAALWEVALDRTGGVWALKAESLETLERAKQSAVVCLGANFIKG